MTDGSGWTDAELAHLRLEGMEFLNRLQSGCATERDEVEFLAWRRQSLAHEEAFRAAVQLQRLVRTVPEPQLATVVPFKRPAANGIGRRALIGGAIAASAAGVVVLGRPLGLTPSLGAPSADYETRAGERRLVRLAGGATVDLNTRTRIALREDLGGAAVELISGEAILASGQGGATHALLVAGRGTSTGRGGLFSARRDGDSVCVTCLVGEVEVAWRDQQRRLRPGHQVVYDDAKFGAVLSGADTRLLTAWQSGTLIFQALPMKAVVAEINRYRPGKVILANDRLAERLLTGTYYVDRLDEFFSQAQLALGVTVTRLPGDVVVLT